MKKITFLLKLTILTGILIILGTAGASDLERIGINDTLSQILLGTGLILSGRLGIMIIKAKRTALKRKARMNKRKAVVISQANAA